VNEKIREAPAMAPEGPPLELGPSDIDAFLGERHAKRRRG
jgi:hypothetical protein